MNGHELVTALARARTMPVWAAMPRHCRRFGFSAFQWPKVATSCRRNRRDRHNSPDHGHAPPGAHSICQSLPGARRAVEPDRENIDWCGGFKPRSDAETRGTRMNADGEPNPAHAKNRAERTAS